jgi:predicted transposase/invertase (TIGR01784 family)
MFPCYLCNFKEKSLTMSKKKQDKAKQNIQNVHDKFFKETFSRLEVAQSFIEELFPTDIREKINLADLKRLSDSFVDGELEEYFSDIIYQTNLANQETLVTLLFEHKSYTVPFIHIQLLQYVINIWKQEIKDGKAVLSLVIPIVIHHGEQRWEYKSMKSYFVDLPQVLHKFIPDFDYLLFSLTDIGDDRLTSLKNVILSMSAMLLKHSHDENDEFMKLTPFWLEKIKELDAQQQLDFIRSVFVYIQNAINLTNNEIPTIFTKVSNNTNNIAMTIADRIRAEEREVTMEFATFQYIKGMLEEGFNADTISKAFKLPIKKVQEIIQKIKEPNQ